MASDAADDPVTTQGGRGLTTWVGLAVAGLGYYFGLKPSGIWATALGAVLAAIGGVVLFGWGLLMRHYTRALKDARDQRRGTDRQPYVRLRAALLAGQPAIMYEESLRRALRRVDRFFGDSEPATQSRFLGPVVFGLTEQAPLWTEAAYDRCLLLALLYPIAVIVILWVATGNVGPAEHAWYLYEDFPPIRRIAIILPFVLAACLPKPLLFVERRCSRRVARLALLAAFATLAVAFGLALAAVGIVAFAVVGAVVVAVVALVAGTSAGIGAGAVAGTIAFAGAVGFADSVYAAFHLYAAGSFTSLSFMVAFAAGVARAAGLARARGWHSAFLAGLSAILLTLCLALPHWLATSGEWPIAGPVLVFLGLLTLVNAPFDWFSLGLTRALLRRGLERGGWWPYAYAALDAIVAVAVIAVLAVAMLLAVQCFDDVAKRAGGDASFDLPFLLDSIATSPASPETGSTRPCSRP